MKNSAAQRNDTFRKCDIPRSLAYPIQSGYDVLWLVISAEVVALNRPIGLAHPLQQRPG